MTKASQLGNTRVELNQTGSFVPRQVLRVCCNALGPFRPAPT